MDSFWLIILQIGIIDIVFSLDTVFTAVGLANRVEVMIAAIVVSVLVMMVVSSAVERLHRAAPDHQRAGPGVHGAGGLLVDGANPCDVEIPQGYLYFAMAFSAAVEWINMRLRGGGKE